VLRRPLLALAVLALVGGLAACGGGVRNALDPVAAAADKTAGAGGVKVAMDLELALAGQTGSIQGRGSFDRQEGELTFDLSHMLGGSQGGLPAGMGNQVKMVYKTEDGHPVVYVNLPFLASMLPGGQSWMKADVERLSKVLGVGTGNMLGGSSQNPADTLELLRAAGDVQKVGSEEIDGTQTTHYRATVDLEQAAEKKGVPPELVQRYRAAGMPAQFPVDVWIGDGDGLVRRMQLDYDMTVQGQSGSLELTMTMHDWGTDVSVDAPPASDVFDATELAANAGKLNKS
jgi:hypothetical protein